LASDWTCTHEFLHLGVPRLPPEDAWLFEGLATYYTELVRARAGVITPREAYQHLLDGFERGKKQAWARTLRQASAEMRETRAFYRVYWSGAALAFLTDVAARRAGSATLDDALRSFAQCCAASEREWTAEQVLAALDATLGTPRFAPLAKAWLDRAAFPDVTPLLRELGVSPGAGKEANFTAAPSAALRDAIMARAPAPSEPAANRDPQ
jgi:predicted metalloprotease with PDZ domain